MFYATGLTGWQRAAGGQPAPVAAPVAPVAPAPVAETPQGVVEQELASLHAQADQTAAALEQIRQRIEELAAANSQETTD